MKILIAGKNSFIARSISQKLVEDGYNIVALSRNQVDFTNTSQVINLFQNNHLFDCVINCCANGGRKYICPDTLQNFHDNIKINENLILCKNYYNKMIMFSSGSEFNQEKDIFNFKESQYSTIPSNYYALSKFINSKRAENEDKITNLRLFNVFGPLEKTDRFIMTALDCYINKKPIEIWHNIYLDFFYIDDLFSIIEYVIKNNDVKELNCCYKEKYKMSEVVEIINGLNNYKIPVIINSKEGNNYCGNGDKLNLIKEIKLKGLKQGIIETYDEIRKEK